MAGNSRQYLVAAKPFTIITPRQARGSRRSVYALELRVTCSDTDAVVAATRPPAGAKPFVLRLDTGNAGEGSLSLKDFEGCVNSRHAYKDLPNYYAETTFADGSKSRPRCWRGDLWIHFDGAVSGNPNPVVVRLKQGLPVFPDEASVSTLGLRTLRGLGASVEIDFRKQEFSILLPS